MSENTENVIELNYLIYFNCKMPFRFNGQIPFSITGLSVPTMMVGEGCAPEKLARIPQTAADPCQCALPVGHGPRALERHRFTFWEEMIW